MDGDVRARRQALEEQIGQVQQAVSRIQALSDRHWYALAPAVRAMDAGTWFGPKGREFGAATHSDEAELRAQLSKAVHDARRKLAQLQNQLGGLK